MSAAPARDTANETPPVIAASPAVAPRTRRSKKWLFLVVVVVALVVGTGLWATQRGIESTDDAQLDADVVAVPARVGGVVKAVMFGENQRVKEGELLAVLDDEPAKAKLAQAEANIKVAEATAEAAEADAQVTQTNATGNKAVAQAALKTASVGATTASDQILEADAAVKSAESTLAQAALERDRDKKLYDSGALSKAAYDQRDTAYIIAQTNLDAAKARLATLRSSATQAKTKIVEASAKLQQSSDVDTLMTLARARAKSARAAVDTAKALRDLAKLDLSYTRILAPADGVVSKKTIAVGQAVAQGQTVVMLVTAANWVTANFKETQIAHMRVGQSADIAVDAFPGRHFKGTVDSFAGATGSRFTLLPPDNASGNFTKVVQRVPIRVKIVNPPSDIELRPGMSVDLSVDTR